LIRSCSTAPRYVHASRSDSWADINNFVGGKVSTRQRSGFKPRSRSALRFWLFDVCVFAIRPSWPAFMLTLGHACSCFRRHQTMGSKSKTFQADGLTCHPFLERSLLISAKVRMFVPYSCISVTHPLDVLSCSTGDGHQWTDTRNVPPGALAPDRINAPIFDPVFPEHQARSTAERDSFEMYVHARL
jgi:hypothetical protein